LSYTGWCSAWCSSGFCFFRDKWRRSLAGSACCFFVGFRFALPNQFLKEVGSLAAPDTSGRVIVPYRFSVLHFLFPKRKWEVFFAHFLFSKESRLMGFASLYPSYKRGFFPKESRGVFGGQSPQVHSIGFLCQPFFFLKERLEVFFLLAGKARTFYSFLYSLFMLLSTA